MTKRGRPKNPPRPDKDTGTPELQRKRMAISPHDQTQASNPLDALKSRQIISEEAHSAAVHFLACRAIMFGNPHPQAVNLLHVQGNMGESRDEDYRAKIELRYRDACDALRKRGRTVLDAIENLVVHERWPDWFFRSRGNRKGRQHCMEGFAALLAWHRDP